MVNRLLDEGADVNLCDKNGDTPLIKAIWSTMGSTVNNEEVLKVIKRLVALGANINAKNLTGRTGLLTNFIIFFFNTSNHNNKNIFLFKSSFYINLSKLN